MEIADRIKHRRLKLMLTQNDLAVKSGISYGGVQAYERGQIPKGDNLLKIAKALQCSLDWLMTGESFNDENKEIEDSKEIRQPSPMILEITKSEKISSPLPDIDPGIVAAIPKVEGHLAEDSGALILGDMIVSYYFFRKDWLNTFGDIKDLVLLDVVGDFMEPTLDEGDTVMVHMGRKKITAGGLYALADGDIIMVKRLQPFIGGRVEIRGDNRSYGHQILDPAKEPLRIIGQIIWIAKRLVK